MDRKKAQIFLLLAFVTSAGAFGLLCLFCRQANLTEDQKNPFFLLAALGYIATTLSLFLASKSINSNLQSEENARATLLSSLSKVEADPAKLADISLEKIAAEVVREIEELKQAERAIVDFSPEIVCSLNERAEIIEINANAESIWQHANMSLIGASIVKLAHSSDASALEHYLHECKTGKEQKPLDCRFLSATGRYIDIAVQAEWSASGQRFYCVATDISAKKEIERLKAEISSMVSHDLRAPVSALSFFLEGLLGGEFGTLTEGGRAQVLRLKDSMEQVLRLINQLLDAEKLEAGGINVEIKVVPVSAVIETSTSILAPLTKQKQLSIDAAETDELVFADFDRMVQVFSNLLSNAIKWSPEGSQIKIKVSSDNEMVKVEVADQGPGIPVDRWSMIFERFKTVDSKSSASGAGLGLYISKTLIELQNGQMGVYSVPGKGASFWFSLKRASEKDLPGYLD